jgi:putative tricarboxylic transport membrane protein
MGSRAWSGVLVGLLVGAASLGCRSRETNLAECIAPANPGGGWDLTCRSVSRLLFELKLVPRPLRVTNMPGAGGGLAFAHLVADRASDEQLLTAASPATTLRLAQGQFGRFTERDVRWVAALAADYGVIAVRADAPWRTLDDLIAACRADPRQVVSGGGSAVGGQDHLKILLLARAAGLVPKSLRYVPFDGGGEAMTALLGGFLSVVPADASEVLPLFRAGRVRVLAVLASHRLSAPFADVPTAAEAGYATEWIVWRGFFAPRNASDQAYFRWVERLRSVANSDEWHEFCRRTAITAFFRGGLDFENFVREQIETFRGLTEALGLRS